jgi:hypothetical protein
MEGNDFQMAREKELGMKKHLFSLLLCAMLLALATVPVGAQRATRTPYTGTENPTYCSDPTADSRCALGSPGETKILPNGKSITRNVVWVIQFISANPQFNGVTIATVNIYPSSDNRTMIIGKWHMEPDGCDGYWEGPVIINVDANGFLSKYTGKGYGDLEGLMIIGINDNGNLSGVIIDLPWHDPK